MHFLLVAATLLATGGSVAACERIDRGKPAQYITFERAGPGKSLHVGESTDRAWLQLHNNTTCAIVFYGGRLHLGPNGVPKMDPDDGSESSVEYDTQDTLHHREPEPWAGGHTHSIASLLGGYSVIFDVPLSHFRAGRNIAVPFVYSWEGEFVRAFRVRHHVFLDPEDLPESVRGRLKLRASRQVTG